MDTRVTIYDINLSCDQLPDSSVVPAKQHTVTVEKADRGCVFTMQTHALIAWHHDTINECITDVHIFDADSEEFWQATLGCAIDRSHWCRRLPHPRFFWTVRIGCGCNPLARAPSISPNLILIPHDLTDYSVLERSKELDSANYMTWSLRSTKMQTGYGVERAASQLTIRWPCVLHFTAQPLTNAVSSNLNFSLDSEPDLTSRHIPMPIHRCRNIFDWLLHPLIWISSCRNFPEDLTTKFPPQSVVMTNPMLPAIYPRGNYLILLWPFAALRFLAIH